MTLPWRRTNPREDGLRPGMAQRGCGYTVGDRIHPTTEPQIRMDIVTAVQIASLSDQPLGLVELLTESAPVHLDPLGGPAAGVFDDVVSTMVTTGTRWRDSLFAKLRRAREDALQDWPARERRAANRKAMAEDTKLIDRLTWACVVLGVGTVIALAMLIAGIVCTP